MCRDCSIHRQKGKLVSIAKPFCRVISHTSTNKKIAASGRKLKIDCRIALAAVTLFLAAQGASGQTPVPPNAKSTCTVTPANFNTWFEANKVTPNGLVNPANSVTFSTTVPNPPAPNTVNCNFYQWSEQMFLWLNSPAPASYGGTGGRVFDSPIFYTVSNNTLIPNTPGLIKTLAVRTGKPVDTSVGQADGSGNGGAALMTQNGKLVYYAMQVNDVYAYFRTQNQPPAQTLQFPTTQAALDSIVAYAKSIGKTIPDPNALTIEVKSAWIEASGLDKKKYVTMTGIIPTYDKSKPTWTQNGTKTALLALVGMHVVGSVQGHPEMIWATFEHQDNTPNAQYTYIDKSGKTKTVARTVPPKMAFASNTYHGLFNVEHMRAAGPSGLNLKPTAGHTVSPSDTLRLFPWGANTTSPNPIAGSAAASNTEIISINNNVRGMLAPSDIRKNYLFIGATWTDGGAPPTAMGAVPSNQVGTSSLANTTMETYVTLKNQLNNCFACHRTNTVGVSHIFNSLQPLPTAAQK